MIQAAELETAIAETLAGNDDAFRRLVREFNLPVRAYLCAQLYHVDEADDLAQDVFISAYKHLHEFRVGESFQAWLIGIARHKLLMHFRSARRRDSAMDRFRREAQAIVAENLDHLGVVARAEELERLLLCMSRLPDKMRRVVQAGLDGEKPAKLADKLGTSLGAVYQLHYRANQLLRACLKLPA